MQLLHLSPGELAVFGLVLFVASFIRGYSGFGFSAVLMAGLGLILPPAEIVPLALALEVIASIGQARQVWKEVHWRHLAVILLTGILGNPVGVWLLVAVPEETLRIAVYLFIAAASTVLLLAPRLGFPITLPILSAAGFLAGVVNGATALSGLVLALLFTLSGVAPGVMRATLVAYFFATDLWTAFLVAGVGLFDEASLLRIGAALPLLAVGLWLGSKRFISAPPKSFRAVTLSLLLVLSLLGLTRAYF